MLDGNKLKRRRHMRGLSQRDLARALGNDDVSAISEYEQGKRQPQPRTLVKLAAALKCNVEAIMLED